MLGRRTTAALLSLLIATAGCAGFSAEQLDQILRGDGPLDESTVELESFEETPALAEETSVEDVETEPVEESVDTESDVEDIEAGSVEEAADTEPAEEGVETDDESGT